MLAFVASRSSSGMTSTRSYSCSFACCARISSAKDVASAGVFQVVLRVGVLVDAAGDDVSHALAPQRLVAGDGQHGVGAFDAVAVEGVSEEAVLSGDDWNLGF